MTSHHGEALSLLSIIAEIIADICDADERGSLHLAVQSGVESLGFANYNLSCHKRSAQELVTEPTLTSWRQEDLTEYAADGWYDRDPLLDYAAQPAPPIAWSPQDWRNSTQFGDYAEFLSEKGILSGVTAPLTLKDGLISAITTLSYTDAHQTNDTATAVYIIGQAAMSRADAIGINEVCISNDIKRLYELTDLQMEILDWAARGKSNGDIAIITNRTRRVINYHMSGILQKMGVASRAQAVSLISTGAAKNESANT